MILPSYVLDARVLISSTRQAQIERLEWERNYLSSQFVLDGILHEFSRCPHVHLVENASAVGADRGRTERQCGGNLFGSFALAKEAQNLKLTI